LFPEIWASLNPKQQTILRYLAEQINPDPEQRIASYLGNELNYNQFSKAIKTLKALNLVVIKSPGNNLPDTLELHPLVRDFICRRFPKEERARYIDAIIHFYNGMIGKFRAVILNAPYSVLENWTGKVELCLRREHYEEALEALSEVRLSLHKNGYPEEFIRLAIEVLNHLKPAQNEEWQKQHDEIYADLIQTLAQLGRFDDADSWLTRFEKTIIGKTARYILLCHVRAYRYWYESNFQSAIEWANRGIDLKTNSNVDTKYDCAHILALAQRDSRNPIAGAAALKYFLQGEKIETVLTPSNFEPRRGGLFYGNIGRCLQFAGNLDGALICIKQSCKALEKTNDSDILLNLGYAAFWIGEILEVKQEHETAFIAFRRAIAKWKIPSPPRARNATEAANRVREKIPLTTVVPMNDWECDRAFLEWLYK
jgi:tetratricopeptide (TPR) repeat protein